MTSKAKFIWKHRNLLAGAPLLIMLAWPATAAEPMLLLPAALGICIVGAALRGWATCHCRYSAGGNPVLARCGPYSLIRHPLYLGNALVITGAAVASGHLWLVPLVSAWALFVFDAVTRIEEADLPHSYGEEWATYRDAVPKWFPTRFEFSTGVGECRPGLLLREAARVTILLPFTLKYIEGKDLLAYLTIV